MSPEAVIATAKELSTKAAELAKQLREMASKTTDPVFKEVVIRVSGANVHRNCSIRPKLSEIILCK
jgi:F420-dependent methylenetetrahydromethanopterin dehydrogenase